MTAKSPLPVMLLWIFSCALLPGQVQEMEQVDDVDLAGTKLGADGIRILTFRCKVSFDVSGKFFSGAFFVATDPKTKTYWWAILPLPASPDLKRLLWAGDSPRYGIGKTPSGFTVFSMSESRVYFTASAGRYGSDGELAKLVRENFDALPRGYSMTDGHIKLRGVLPEAFFFKPFSAVMEQPKLESVTRLANGDWALAVSSGVGKIAYLDLAPDFSVKRHAVIDSQIPALRKGGGA